MTGPEFISLAVGVIGLLFAIGTYLLSGVLSDKKQTAVHSVEIENLKQRVTRLENDNDKN